MLIKFVDLRYDNYLVTIEQFEDIKRWKKVYNGIPI